MKKVKIKNIHHKERDVKGLYARARRGQITGFTGVDDPYEEPLNAEITLQTVKHSAEDNAYKIVEYLEEVGFLSSDGSNGSGNSEPNEISDKNQLLEEATE